MDESKPDPVPAGKCRCEKFTIVDLPDENKLFRRFLIFMEEHLATLPSEPAEPIKKFRDDLKEADKEYQGIAAIVNKYKLFYEKLEAKLAETKRWKDKIDDWVEDFDPATAKEIKDLWTTSYEKKEQDTCCAWISARDGHYEKFDCAEQAKRQEQEAKDDYDGAKGGGAIKEWEKTLTDRFTELKSLYDQAESLYTEERFNGLYAVSLEYNAVYYNLSAFRDWGYARRKCKGDIAPGGDLKELWSPENYKKKLITALRALVLARYQRFRWQHQFLSLDSDIAAKKAACVKFREGRRAQFIQEAEDVPPPPPKLTGRNEQKPTQLSQI